MVRFMSLSLALSVLSLLSLTLHPSPLPPYDTDPEEDLFSYSRLEKPPSIDSLSGRSTGMAGMAVLDPEEESRRGARVALVSSIITGVGNFSIQYNFESISIALLMMSVVECTGSDQDCRQGHQQPWVAGTANGVAFAGAIAGQLTMGYLGDVLGRNQAMTITLAISSVSALCTALLPVGGADSVYVIIIFFRFMLGIGVGGIFPLAATKAAEDAAQTQLLVREAEQAKTDAIAAAATGRKAPTVVSSANRQEENGAVDSLSSAKSFFWQAPGAMAPWLVACFLTYDDSMSIDTRWRLVLGLGAVPSFGVTVLSIIEARMNPGHLITRVSISVPTNQNTNSSAIEDLTALTGTQNLEIANNSISANRIRLESTASVVSEYGAFDNRMEINLWRALGTWKVQKKLLASGGTWFLYDVCYYGVALFGGQIIGSLDTSGDDDVSSDTNIRNTSIKEMIALSMAIPSMIFSISLLPCFSIKIIQIVGFYFQAICFFLLAVLTNPLKNSPNGLFAVYCLLLFALAGGPGITCYLLPSEMFPKSIRSTCNGISAAAGKLGAVVGAYMYGPLADVTSFPFVFVFCGCGCILGAIVTSSMIPDKKADTLGEKPPVPGTDADDALGIHIGDANTSDRDALLGK